MENPTHLNCPACRSELYPVHWHGIELDICSAGCYGVWFDYGELKAVEQSDTAEAIDRAFVGTYHQRPVQEGLQDPDRYCPRDNTVLTRYEWNVGSGLIMDSCGLCQGIWLDAGELEGFVAYVKRFRESPPQPDPELMAQIASVHQQARLQYNAAVEEAARITVPWDIAFIDDILRGVLQFMVRRVSK